MNAETIANTASLRFIHEAVADLATNANRFSTPEDRYYRHSTIKAQLAEVRAGIRYMNRAAAELRQASASLWTQGRYLHADYFLRAAKEVESRCADLRGVAAQANGTGSV